MHKDEINDTSNKEKNLSIDLILSQEFEEFKKEIEKLRAELTMLLLERDELQFVICKNIEMKYMLKLGDLEYKTHEAQCTALRLKRKIELIQAKKNRQEKINISEIEKILDKEFEEYKDQLEEQIHKINDAIKRSKGKLLTDEESKELKKIYRKIVKVLHPDMNPKVTKEQLRLFVNAVTAYKDGDLDTLRFINEIINDNKSYDINNDDNPADKKEYLQRAIRSVQMSIEHIKSEFPYTMRDIVNDDELIKQNRQKLEDALKQYNELIIVYKNKIEEMLR